MTTSERWPQKYTLRGIDMYGRDEVFHVVHRPPLFFWLGGEADPIWPIVTKIVLHR